MASIVYPDAGLPHLANRVLGGGIHFHLFVNNIFVTKETTLEHFVEPDIDDYEPILVDEWTTQSVVLHHGVNQGDEINFFNTDDEEDLTVYGYFVTNIAGDELLWAVKFDGPVPWEAEGGVIPITPYYGDFSRNPPED